MNSTQALRAEDVDERFIRGSGPGGQKINKTSSTVWLRHRPTGIEVRCQKERSQAANRAAAWAELASKLAARNEEAVRREVEARELERRRHRQKSRGQKRRMVESKARRARTKSERNSIDW